MLLIHSVRLIHRGFIIETSVKTYTKGNHNMTTEVDNLLSQLRLAGMRESFSNRNKEAIKGKLSYQDFLKILAQDELLHRQNKRFKRQIKAANFKSEKTIENFDFNFNPKINEQQIKDLASCQFIQEASPIHIIGPSGTGKSDLAQALSRCALMKGHEALFISQSELSSQLQLALATNTLSKLKKKLTTVAVLVIDDFGIKPFSESLEDFLHDIVDHRYERLPIIITSNLDFKEWSDAFRNKLLASAVIDRLKGNAYEVILTGKSYRQTKSENKNIEKDQEV